MPKTPYFTKDELLDLLQQAGKGREKIPQAEHMSACVEMLYDSVATAPIMALVLLLSNRVKMINPRTAPCSEVHRLVDDMELLTNTINVLMAEHVLYRHLLTDVE